MLAEGRLVNLGCATGHPSFVMSCSFSAQVVSCLEILKNNENYQEPKLYAVPRIYDEKIAKYHVLALKGNMTTLTEQQSRYLSISRDGPYKATNYKY